MRPRLYLRETLEHSSPMTDESGPQRTNAVHVRLQNNTK